MTETNTRSIILRAEAAATTAGAAGVRSLWQGKILRVRAFVDDGFWVRAHFVMAAGLWASLRGLPFFVHLHTNASCAHTAAACAAETSQPKELCTERRTCDAYSSPLGLGSARGGASPGWEEYFEPIHGRSAHDVYASTPMENIVEMSCAAGWFVTEGVMGGRMATKKAWGSGYPEDWRGALAYRQRNAELVSAWVRVRADIRSLADSEWSRLVRGSPPVIGVHLCA